MGHFIQQQHQTSSVPTFTYNALKQATNNFSQDHVIGRGSYGTVYHGTLNTTPVAVKVLNPAGSQGELEFYREVAILARVKHPNITALVGACKEKMCLVYELAARGSLHDQLHARDVTDREMLTWSMRIRIALEVAGALAYLHAL